MFRLPSTRAPLGLCFALSVLTAAAALHGARAVAQQGRVATPTAPAPKPVSTEPGSTTASFGDWVLRCQRGAGERAVRVCEAAQSMQVQGQTAPIAQIAIGRLNPGEPLLVTTILPPNIALPSSVRVFADERETPGFELTWRRCLPGSCIADAPSREDVLKRWRGSAEPGRITFRNAAGQDIGIPLSFRGLAQALDALAKEPA